MEVCAKIRRRGFHVLTALAIALCATAAWGDAFESLANQRPILPGGRASALGGAFTAVADDPSASYYNPAGLAFTKENKLEFSATAYQTADLEYEHTINDKPFVEHSEAIFPNFIGGTARAGWLTVGYSFMTLDARNIYQQNKYADISTNDGAANSYSRTYQESSSYIWAGGSAAIKLGDHLSYGTSVFYYQRNIEFSTNELIQLNGGGLLSITDTLKTLNTGLAGVNGIMWNDKDYSLGAGVRTAMSMSDRSLLLIDRVQYDPSATTKDANGNPDYTTVTNTRLTDRALDELNPTTYVVGAAWHPSQYFLLAGDFLVHEGVVSPYHDRGGYDLHTTYDYSVGSELRAGPINLMLGYFTNNSMYRPPDPNTPGHPLYVNFVGESVGLGWDFSSLHGAVGALRQTGKGQAQIRSGDPSIQQVKGSSTTYVISGKVPL